MTNYFCLFCSTAQLLSVSLRRRQTSPLTQMHNYIRVRGSRTWNSFWPRGERLAALCEGCSFPSCFHHPDRRSRPSLAWSVNQMDSIDHLPGNNVFSPLCAAGCAQCGYGDILILSKLAMQYFLEFLHNGSHVGVKILCAYFQIPLEKWHAVYFTELSCKSPESSTNNSLVDFPPYFPATTDFSDLPNVWKRSRKWPAYSQTLVFHPTSAGAVLHGEFPILTQQKQRI